MKIKKLEIKGFKSFPDKTHLEFKPGITSIVGPNGCGKSNVLEAIRWVMGEQRVRSLRGKKMEDVIFNGSENRKPLGMAEVRLVLSADGGESPPAMGDYDEIMIARRLFRNGDSQYEINNVPCRLSDVVDFFLDTGVGKNSYAVIEQGRVDMVVASKPEDRRVLIEEAAGISRYKARKEAAVKKLEQTSQNLTRIKDIIGEVKRQSASLKRQAQKAERYCLLRDRVRLMDLGLHAFKCRNLETDLETGRRDLSEKQSTLAEHEAKLGTVQAELEELRLKSLNTERELKELLESVHGLDIELTQLHGTIERDRDAVNRTRENSTRAQERRESLTEQSCRAAANLEEIKGRRDELRSALESARADLTNALSDLKTCENTLAAERQATESNKEELFRTLQELAQRRNKKEAADKRRAQVEGEREKLNGEFAESQSSLESVSSRALELKSLIASAEERLASVCADRDLDLARQRECRARISGLRDDLAQSEQELAATGARLESITEMRESFQAYDEGVRFLMQDRSLAEQNGLIAPLAELIDVPESFQAALTAALGDRLGSIVAADPEDAFNAAGELNRNNAGRAVFLPVCPRGYDVASSADAPEGAVPLKDVVHFHSDAAELRDFLLDGVYAVEDARTALEWWNHHPGEIDLVTSSGERITRHGVVSGGKSGHGTDSVFEHRRKEQQLRARNAELDTSIRSLRSAIHSDEELLQSIETRLEEHERVRQEIILEKSNLVKDRENLGHERAQLAKRVEVLQLELRRLDGESQQLSAATVELDRDIAELEQRKQSLEQGTDASRELLEKLAAQVRTRSDGVGELRIAAAQMEERSAALDREYESAQKSSESLKKNLEDLEREIRTAADEEQRLLRSIEENTQKRDKLVVRRGDLSAKSERVKDESAALTESVKGREAELASMEKAARETRDEVHHIEMELTRAEQSLDAVVERMIDRYRADPRTIEAPAEIPDEAEIAELREKLQSFGEVNLSAIEESKEGDERLAFLEEQERDLNAAVESLYETINKINKTTRERFREAFEKVDAQFRKIFPVLFNGGEARLELTDENNLLETGVEIMARPPGKRVRNMDLLSGGEKALTAVGLIFSIFLTRPSPFCILDEVDAPLDDSNIVRFNTMLKQLSDRTQFLIITHNKRTMETADSLYGVTMEEPGASRVVSVEFRNQPQPVDHNPHDSIAVSAF